MIELNMSGCQVGVGEVANGGNKVLRIADPQSGIVVLMQLDPMAAISMANALTGKTLVVPQSELPTDWRPNGGAG
jgi:hypothetical protein